MSCAVCGKQTRAAKNKTCSRQCHSVARWGVRALPTCTVCGRPTKTKRNRTCSNSCARGGTPAQRLWSKIEVGAPDGCWVWTGSVCSQGYGTIRVTDGKIESTHRLVYELVKGTIPEKMSVLHSCDNPPCCNPAHLRLGTHADNMRDRSERRRGWGTKLCNEDVVEIRSLLAAGWPTKAVAARFAVCKASIGYIKTGRTWRHV